LSYCTDWLEKCFQNMKEKGFENRGMKEKCAERIDTLRVHFRWTTWEVGLRWVNWLEIGVMITFIKPPICI